MGCLTNSDNSIWICGNFNPITKQKPENWHETGYKMMVDYPFPDREKIGKIECDCKQVLECFQAWYGYNWYHSDDCALIKAIEKRPQLINLWCYQHLPEIPVD